MKYIPLLLCVSLFIFTTIGFFKTSGKNELLYGACSIGGIACAIVQLAIVF